MDDDVADYDVNDYVVVDNDDKVDGDVVGDEEDDYDAVALDDDYGVDDDDDANQNDDLLVSRKVLF